MDGYVSSFTEARFFKVGTGDVTSGGGSVKRGKITGMSSGSSRRLKKSIAQLRLDENVVFGTLTFPDELSFGPKDSEKVKLMLDKLGKRLLRKFPCVLLYWKLEAIDRKSGSRIGEDIIHIHSLSWGVPEKMLVEWVPTSWYQVVGSGLEKHLKSGTSFERVRKPKGITRYVGKYIAKRGDKNGILGRNWGVIGRKNRLLYLSVEDYFGLDRDVSIKMIRLLRKKMRIKGRSFKHSLSIITDNPGRYLEWARRLQEEKI